MIRQKKLSNALLTTKSSIMIILRIYQRILIKLACWKNWVKVNLNKV